MADSAPSDPAYSVTVVDPSQTGKPLVGYPCPGEDLVFFDGTCGLCHAAVRFVLRHERPTSAQPRFAPLFGETYDRLIKPMAPAQVPDSVHVLTRDGCLLIRSRAVIHLCRGIGGGWATLGSIASWCPTVLLDVVYRGVAATRKRLWSVPDTVCPIVDSHLRDRFLP